MITVDEEWWIAEAGEYVLGTLRGSERVLFERFIERDNDIRALVDYWETYFYPLNELTPAVAPSPEIWNRIRSSIEQQELSSNSSDLPTRSTDTLDPKRPELSAQEQRNIKPHAALRALTSLALAASLILGVWLVFKLQQSPPETPNIYDSMTVIASEEGSGLWAITADSESNTIKVIALAPPAIDDSNDYQLWQIKPNDTGVNSVGLLPQNTGGVQEFSATFPISDSVAFAVSLEPAGGSPNPVPSGPVLYSGTITALDESI